MITPPCLYRTLLAACLAAATALTAPPQLASQETGAQATPDQGIEFSIRSARSGDWSDPQTWQPPRIPRAGDRVLIARDTRVVYDVESDDVIRLLQVMGMLSFSRQRDTLLNAGLIKVQNSDTCSEDGFACDFAGVNLAGEPTGPRAGVMPTLEIGTSDNPIPAQHTARIRLHYLDGMNKDDAPALVCCSARMEIHGAPLSRTWVKLARDAQPGDEALELAEPVTGWRVGDDVLITGSRRAEFGSRLRDHPEDAASEVRRVSRIDGAVLHLDAPLTREHYGSGEFKSEAANLSRNVVIESAQPDGVRGHTIYHAFSRGGISYARFAHLGKEGVLGRYPIHFHLVGDTMRGSQVLGASIVDSGNRWVTIHGTQYLVVRDCVGYQSVGHGYFMEDGTEVYNLLDGNLGVQAYGGRRLPKQVLPFDPNDGAAFWWANGRNTLIRNVASENEEYGFRYDMQNSRYFSSTLPVLMPDGATREVDVRTIPIWRFEDNESHTEGLYGLVVAANGNSQPDSPIRDERMLQRIRSIDWTGPDSRHPHVIRNMRIWESHYAFRPHSPSMLMENVRIHRAAYGIYRPALDDHVYRDLHLSDVGPEPFNRGMDDASAQMGRITVDGFSINNLRHGNQRHPVVHMSDNDLTGAAESHFRNVSIPADERPRRPMFNLGGSVRVDPFVDDGVPYFVHDFFGPGRHAKIVSTKAAELVSDGNDYRQQFPLTGDESVVAEVRNVPWPELLEPIDDLPPATVITSLREKDGSLIATGVSHDNGEITQVTVNGKQAKIISRGPGVVDWRISLKQHDDGIIAAHARDSAGNIEKTAHRRNLHGNLLSGDGAHDHAHAGH